MVFRKRILWVLLALWLTGCRLGALQDVTPEPVRIEAVTAASTPAFERAYEPQIFTFPEDHGPHFGFQTEWWYFTGNLTSTDGRQFGFQLTFFRRGLAPEEADRNSPMGSNQIYFAHFAVTDIESGRHTSVERFSRGAEALAGASGAPFEVWLEDWRVESLSEQGDRLMLIAGQAGMSIELALNAEKPVVVHGESGLSAKSEEPGNASYYLSFTRMGAAGELRVGGEQFQVQGTAWFDHEWSTSALGPQAQGWDWFSLQLSNQTELMYFQIRNQDGSLDPVSGGTWVEPDGNSRHLDSTQLVLDVLGEWSSPDTDTIYPSGWRISVPELDLELWVEPWIDNQEMLTSFVYWEGAVRISGTMQGEQVSGVGYVELTGYLESMQGVF